jgi:hypothetical protein
MPPRARRAAVALLLLLLSPATALAGWQTNAVARIPPGTPLPDAWAYGAALARGLHADRDGSYRSQENGLVASSSIAGAVQVITGERERDRALVKRGLRSLRVGCASHAANPQFRVLATALAVRAMRGAGARPPVWVLQCLASAPAGAPGWSRGDILPQARYLSNLQWIEYAAMRQARIALGRDGRRWIRPGSLVSGRYDGTMKRVLRQTGVVMDSDGGCFFQGDPGQPDHWAYGYHVLTTAMMLLAGDSRWRCGARAVRSIQAPDGDVAYVGRSYEQAWAAAAAVLALDRSGDRARAARSLDRLRRLHLRPGGQFVMTPTLQNLDAYAGPVSYTAFPALLLLVAGRRAGSGTPLPATTRTVSSPVYEITETPFRWRSRHVHGISPQSAGDGRYVSGLVREKLLEDFGWQDAVPDLVP